MIPLLIRSANVVHSLPDRISSTGGEDREWVEVGVVAKIVLDICQFNALDGNKTACRCIIPLIRDHSLGSENFFRP